MNKTLENQAKNRRTFLRSSLSVGAALGGTTLLTGPIVSAQQTNATAAKLSAGDIAILRFVAAAELIESDLWQQYAELGGITNEPQNPYQKALLNLDSDGLQYITSNSLDELSHAEFLNAYLIAKGAEPVDFDRFRTPKQ